MTDRRPVRVLELRSVRGTGGGPEKTILLGAAKHDPERASVTVCYVRDNRDDVFSIDRRAQQMEVDYVEILERHSYDLRAVWRQLTDLVRDRGIDVVHSHDYKTDALAWWLGRHQPVATIATAHGWTGDSVRERLVYYPLNRRCLARFPLVIAVSSDIRQKLLDAGAAPDRVRVLLNAIDPNLFRRDPVRVPPARTAYGFGPGDVVIGSVGRLEVQKRFDLLIDAVARARSVDPRLRLIIAGEGSQRGVLESKITGGGLDGIVRLAGQQPDVIAFHHALDLFVQSSDYEGTPNVVLEAMALETPIVATNVGGTAEIAIDREHALLVHPGSAELLVSAIGTVLTDPASTHTRVAAARRRVEGPLSFATRVRALEDTYLEIAAVRPR